MLTHRLAAADFDALAAGLGSPSLISILRSAQLSRRLIALRAVLDAAERAARQDALAGLDLLSDVQCTDSAAVTSLLCYPFTGAWAAHCLRLLGNADDARTGDNAADARTGDIATDLGYLSNIAAAAAIRAGGPFSIDVPVRDGAVCLPTLGRAFVDGGPAVAVRSDGQVVTVGSVPVAEGPHWQPVRRLSARAGGRHLTIALDDIDPYRGPGLPIAARLDDDAVRGWQASLAAAWDILIRHHRGYAEGIGAGLAAIVPLATARQNRGVNATSRESFGAAAISPAADPLTLAVALLHEVQHGVLNALLDIVPLYRPDEARYYAPWRQDPRPIGGLLHGAYAHAGVSDFWRVQSTLATTPFPAYAQLEYARWSASTRQVIDTLLDSGSLTSAGERFVLGMRGRMHRWADNISDETARLAGMAAADHRLGWRLRNLRPAAAAVDSLACTWLAGEAVPAGEAIPAELVDGGGCLGVSDRLDLLYLRLREPEHLARAEAEQQMDPADVNLITENAAAAANAYRERIKAEPRDLEAWAGLALALALRETGDCPEALLHGPEIVCAVYCRVLERTGGGPDPESLASWLGPACRPGRPADPIQVSGRAVPSRTR
jgi:HEXXH motif-containing protein